MDITENVIPHIEKAMDFELHDNQKAYLLGTGGLTGGRNTGKTTAFCIKLALSEGEPLDLKHPETFSDGWGLSNKHTYARGFFIHEFMRIRLKLKMYGFKVRPVRLKFGRVDSGN